MKNNTVKRHKLAALLLAGALCVAALTGCGASAAAAPSASAAPALSSKTGGTYKVGLIQLVTHTSLDEIRTAIVAELKTEAAAQGVTVSVDYKNAENDQAAQGRQKDQQRVHGDIGADDDGTQQIVR